MSLSPPESPPSYPFLFFGAVYLLETCQYLTHEPYHGAHGTLAPLCSECGQETQDWLPQEPLGNAESQEPEKVTESESGFLQDTKLITLMNIHVQEKLVWLMHALQG